jgi:hypothetical protein
MYLIRSAWFTAIMVFAQPQSPHLRKQGTATQLVAARIQDGKTVEVLSTLAPANWQADANAFASLMRHIREVDGNAHTLLMMQVENEVGVLGDWRDRSDAAKQAFSQAVPRRARRSEYG